MKKIITRLTTLALALVAGTASLSAQLDTDNIRYRAEAGAIVSQITKFGVGEPFYGFRVSGQVLVPFQRSQWALLSGLTLTSKGENSVFYYREGTQTKTTPRTSVSLMYLQLPVNVSHRFDLNRNNRIYLEFGPYLAASIVGKMDGKNLLTALQNHEKAFNTLELGVGASLHYDYKNIYLKVGGEISLSSAVNRTGYMSSNVAGGMPRYGLAYLTLGYQF